MKYLLALLLIFGAACADDFDKYNELIGFRVLALRAEHPDLLVGESTRIEALIHTDDGAAVEYDWSWCPFLGAADTHFDCAVGHDELESMVQAVLPGATIPAYALSATTAAEYSYDLPRDFFSRFCEVLQGQELPAFVTRPDCDGTFEINIRLVARSGGKEIVAIKELQLRYEETPPPVDKINVNPAIEKIEYWPSDQPDTTATLLSAEEPPTLQRDKAYMLRLTVPESASQNALRPGDRPEDPQVEKREILLVTWFTEGGETDSQRTTFIDGEVPLDRLEKNEFTTPRVPDYPGQEIRMAFVIRDDRGGAGWIERSVKLGE